MDETVAKNATTATNSSPSLSVGHRIANRDKGT